MRARIITSPSFTGERILGAILFENTMDRDIDAATAPLVVAAGANVLVAGTALFIVRRTMNATASRLPNPSPFPSPPRGRGRG